ncbi:putative oxidoreductase [Aspergillus pseudoustus]|uniref:Oxidoreductase n=1 Tax=Aspergillus pseudoustus TaxID=1810923 RepID=A0ABR4J0P0_9EURO
MSSNMYSNITSCCLSLLTLLGPKVSLPETATYNTSISSYFTQQNAQLHPSCIVTPTSASDVSIILKTLTSQNQIHHGKKPTCPFALRSGGHAFNTAFNNINSDGITIDLSNLSSITLSADRAIASIGPGATWGDVYTLLDPLDLTVPGGRAAQVGVGGLTLGGGISYFSPRTGWTCDSVVNFEIVRAGEIVNANATHNAELWSALCGGGNANFGIVTRLDLRTLEQPKNIWGGFVYYTLDTVAAQLRAFEGLNSAEGYDEYASLITSFAFSAGSGGLVVNSVVYTKEEEYPAVYAPFFEIPAVASTVRIASLGEITIGQGSYSPDGRRQASATITHTSTIPILNATYTRWNASLASVKSIPGIVWALNLEPLPPAIYARHARTNSLGLSDASDALVVTQLSATWDDERDDETVERAARELIEGIERDARELGGYDEFLYLNYAAEWQDPIRSYGRESVERLRRVQREVDPQGVFRRDVPGGFKIPS